MNFIIPLPHPIRWLARVIANRIERKEIKRAMRKRRKEAKRRTNKC